MFTLRNYIKKVLQFCLLFFFMFFSSFTSLSAEEVNWIEVDKINNGIQFIDVDSIKYNNRGFLSVITKYSETNPDDNAITSTNLYLMAVDCENRLFSKLPLNGELNQVKRWEEPINDRMIKRTIVNSCSY